MRWEALFDDIEAQAEAAEAAGLAAEVTDRTRSETAALRLYDRLRPLVGYPLGVAVQGGRVAGRLVRLGPDWLLLAEAPSREVLIRAGALLSVTGAGAHSATPGDQGVVASRLGLGSALRAVARDRAAVLLGLVDGGALHGTLDRVGADFCELAEHPVGEPRRRGSVRAVHLVPFPALSTVRSG